MKPTVGTGPGVTDAREAGERAIDGVPVEGATVDDAELGRRVVEWLRRDAEGRRILLALVEHPEVGRVALARRLQRPGFLEPGAEPGGSTDHDGNGVSAAAVALTGRAVARRPLERPDPLGGAAAGGLPHRLRLTASALFLGGVAAFVLGVVTLGRADPSFPPMSVFGLALMILSALPALAGSDLCARRWPAMSRLPAAPVTAAVVAIAVTIAVAAARVIG